MHFDLAVVVDVTKLAEFGHELADARTCRADHARERLLGDRHVDNIRLIIESDGRQCHQYSRQSLLARIEQLVDQIRLQFLIAA